MKRGPFNWKAACGVIATGPCGREAVPYTSPALRFVWPWRIYWVLNPERWQAEGAD